MSNIFGKKLDPYQEIKTMMTIKGKQQRVKVFHIPSTINQTEDLNENMPNMGQNDASSLEMLGSCSIWS